jgi:hypothetical protein
LYHGGNDFKLDGEIVYGNDPILPYLTSSYNRYTYYTTITFTVTARNMLEETDPPVSETFEVIDPITWRMFIDSTEAIYSSIVFGIDSLNNDIVTANRNPLYISSGGSGYVYADDYIYGSEYSSIV